MKKITFFIVVIYALCLVSAHAQRTHISLDQDWNTTFHASDSAYYEGFQDINYVEGNEWSSVAVPHNWDQYDGYRRLLHGNLHGTAWYRKEFRLQDSKEGKRFYLFFEGVGSYAKVWLNGEYIGQHAGGRTTFTLDVTGAIHLDGKRNILAVRADHPEGIRDLPWVDGGCSPERGFSEGSQPLGIFRPVSLVVKNEVNIVPFGVHYWNDQNISEVHADVHQTVELQNESARSRKLTIQSTAFDKDHNVVAVTENDTYLSSGEVKVIELSDIAIEKPVLWHPDTPYLYTIRTLIKEGNEVLDIENTAYGVRSVSWPKGLKPNGSNQLFVNGKAVFIHGIAEYEHKFGNSHAFDSLEIASRVRDIKSLGFNSFRDAHQPHNLRYQKFWDETGVLLWTQMAAHIWFDTPEFRANFKRLLVDWVKERRNSPSVFLWGLENESTLPESFARECTELIRSLDPTASIQRLVTTCNGGSGTDWDVPQNWTGTYGGHHNTYGEDLKRQLLVGEYGAWRTLELHAEPPYLPNDNLYSEERFSEILETKLRLADSVKDETIGHYLWLYNSHDNPGRVQGGEAFRDLDKIGPVNYKGIYTPWGEPTDAYYMYRSHYSPKTSPMVYIASHTWPHRWTESGVKPAIRVYSNCDEVELFNDIEDRSLGVIPNPGRGRCFEFRNVDIQYNVLYAVGRIDGKVVVRDTVVLSHLPNSPHYTRLYLDSSNIVAGDSSLDYVYRVNAGGPRYTDTFGQTWMADQPYTEHTAWGSRSWSDGFEGVPPFFASQRRTFDPIKGTKDWSLFQTLRYGQDQLSYTFDVDAGEYVVELFFAEPWLGTGGISDVDGFRVFDIAINGELVEHKMDIWNEVGHDRALKKTYRIIAKDGNIVVNFPRVYAGQALLNAIAIGIDKSNVSRERVGRKSLPHYNVQSNSLSSDNVGAWLDITSDMDSIVKGGLHFLPPYLYGADFFTLAKKNAEENVSFRFPTSFYAISRSGLEGFEDMGDSVVLRNGEHYSVYRRNLSVDESLYLKAEDVLFYAFQIRSDLQPAFDLKTVESYAAVATSQRKGVKKVNFQQRDRLQFIADSSLSYVEWEIHVGVADVYSLTFKYHNPFQTIQQGAFEVLTVDGSVLTPRTPVAYQPTREGKWNYIDQTTGTMINAGTYRVRLYSQDAKGIYIDNLDVR